MAIWLGTIDWWIVTIGISELTGEEILMTLKILFWISTFYSLDTLTNIFNTFFIHFCKFRKSVFIQIRASGVGRMWQVILWQTSSMINSMHPVIKYIENMIFFNARMKRIIYIFHTIVEIENLGWTARPPDTRYFLNGTVIVILWNIFHAQYEKLLIMQFLFMLLWMVLWLYIVVYISSGSQFLIQN